MSVERDRAAAARELAVRAGLCGTCRHAHRVVSDRGSCFLLCGRAAEDPRFARYPRLPVLRCAGFETAAVGGGPSRGEAERGPGRPG